MSSTIAANSVFGESAPNELVALGRSWNWTTRRGLWLVCVAPVSAHLIGSAFNIWYNSAHIDPLLSVSQYLLFLRTILAYNALAYPIAAGIWCWAVFSIRSCFAASLRGDPQDESLLSAARRRAINLPWRVAIVSGVAWAMAVPAFLASLASSPEPLAPQAGAHLGISLSIGGMIAVTQSAFVVEFAAHRWLFPVLFQTIQPTGIADALPLTLRGRGVMWAITAGVCPVVVLLLLVLAPGPSGAGFAITVAGFAAAFALSTAWFLGATVAQPIRELREAARRVTAGDLSTRVDLVRADEFGLLIAAFNRMVSELREKQALMETFGRHVGRDAAQMILQRDPSLGGIEKTITVMFADIRNFTARCGDCSAQKTVAVLNAFFSEMVEAVENECGGMVNKFVGDGFLALFGAESRQSNHSEMAVKAGRRMLERLAALNERLQQQGHAPLEIGIGIHTGSAVVGSIGSPRRRDFTAIGDTVNVASRVEGLTKSVGETMLITEPTRAALPPYVVARRLPPQKVKGKEEPITVYGVDVGNRETGTR